MRKRLRLLFFGLGLLLPCAWLALLVFLPRDHINARTIVRIKEGMTAAEVTAILGTPPDPQASRSSVIHYSDLGCPPFLGKERPGLKFLKLKDLHAVEWVGHQEAVKVWFDDHNRVFSVVPGKVLGTGYSLLDRIRRFLAG